MRDPLRTRERLILYSSTPAAGRGIRDAERDYFMGAGLPRIRLVDEVGVPNWNLKKPQTRNAL